MYFTVIFHITASSAFYRILLSKCAFCRSKCIVMWVKQTGLASETLFWRSKHFDLLRIVGRKDWTQTERAGWPAGVRRLGEWVTSITKRATLKLANLHINHSDYLYHQHRDDHQVEQHTLLIIMITTLGFNIMMTSMMNVMRIIVMTDTMFITTSSNPNTTWRPASLPEKAR